MELLLTNGRETNAGIWSPAQKHEIRCSLLSGNASSNCKLASFLSRQKIVMFLPELLWVVCSVDNQILSKEKVW